MLMIQLVSWLMMVLPQGALDITVPEDVLVWGGLSLAVIFRVVVVPALLALGILTDENKKTVGGWLIAVGAAVATIYSIFTAKLNDPMALFTNLVAGGFAGIGAVGLHSTHKNFKEWLAARKK